MASKKPPTKFRRLTKEEAEKFGVSYASKHAVDASIPKGKATKRNKVYSNRQAYQLTEKVTADESGNIEIKRRGSKEKVTKSRQYKDDYSVRYLNVKPDDYARIIKLAAGHSTQILVYGNDGITKYGVNNEMKFNATPSIGPDELGEHLDRLNSERGLGSLPGFNASNKPARIDIRVRLRSRSDMTPEQVERIKAKHKKAKKK